MVSEPFEVLDGGGRQKLVPGAGAVMFDDVFGPLRAHGREDLISDQDDQKSGRLVASACAGNGKAPAPHCRLRLEKFDNSRTV